MKPRIKKTDDHVRKTRNGAGKTFPNIPKAKMTGRRFDSVAYAAALEVLG